MYLSKLQDKFVQITKCISPVVLRVELFIITCYDELLPSPKEWEIKELSVGLSDAWIGDCRKMSARCLELFIRCFIVLEMVRKMLTLFKVD